MTIERPMFPPMADERGQVIQLSEARISSKRRKPIVSAAILSSDFPAEFEQEPERPARDARGHPATDSSS